MEELLLKKVRYEDLKSKEKESYNFAKVSGRLADFGFECSAVNSDGHGATEDDGSCFFPQATCPSDFNLDWVISIQDVLTLLSAFGMTCPGYEVGTELADCTYAEALNYNADALTDDGSCIFESPCTGDVNGDGTVTVSDLLSLMTVDSTSCE